MSDTWGALPIPLPAPSGGEADGDPCLSRLLAYFKAFLNAKTTAAWQAVYPNSSPVNRIWAHNPEEVSFNEKDLPALYLWRAVEKPYEWLAEDYDISHWTLRLLWVFPPARQEFQRQRATFVNGVSHVLKHAIELGRDPSYVMAGDTDPKAATQGTVIYKAAGIFTLDWGGCKVSPLLPIRMTSGETRGYYCLDATLELGEQRILDIVADFPATGGLDTTITTPDTARDLSVGKS